MFGKKAFFGAALLFGALALLLQAPAAQAHWWRIFRPRPDCPEELMKPPTIMPKEGDETKKEAAKEPVTEPSLTPVTTAALGDSTTSVPHIMGDFFGYCAKRYVILPAPVTRTITTIDNTSGFTVTNGPFVTPGTQKVVVCDPILSRAPGSGFKVADNESPAPVDRVYLTYNYFHSIHGVGGFNPPRNSSVTIGDPAAVTVTTTTTIPGATVPGRNFNVNRELFGFEKTLFDGNASVEFRLPIFQINGGDGGFGRDDLGDMTFVLKYALLNNRETGNVFSLGLAVTAPTGPSINTIDGNINSTLLQPFFGYIRRAGNFYIQGIHSVVIPTDSRDLTLLFNDVGGGYILRTGRNRFLAFIAPNVEAHVSTPLNHRNGNGVIFAPDLVTLTGGVHLGLGDGRPLLSLGVATPVTGPRPFDAEFFVQFGFRF